MANKYLEKAAGFESAFSKVKKFVRTATGEEVKSIAGKHAFERSEARTKIQHIRNIKDMDSRHINEMNSAISDMRKAQSKALIGGAAVIGTSSFAGKLAGKLKKDKNN